MPHDDPPRTNGHPAARLATAEEVAALRADLNQLVHSVTDVTQRLNDAEQATPRRAPLWPWLGVAVMWLATAGIVYSLTRLPAAQWADTGISLAAGTVAGAVIVSWLAAIS